MAKICAFLDGQSPASYENGHSSFERRELAMSLLTNSARALLVLAPAIALASPAFAQSSPPNTFCATVQTPAPTGTPVNCADPSEPGSIIVYQKFQRGFVTVDQGLPGQSGQP